MRLLFSIELHAKRANAIGRDTAPIKVRRTDGAMELTVRSQYLLAIKTGQACHGRTPLSRQANEESEIRDA